MSERLSDYQLYLLEDYAQSEMKKIYAEHLSELIAEVKHLRAPLTDGDLAEIERLFSSAYAYLDVEHDLEDFQDAKRMVRECAPKLIAEVKRLRSPMPDPELAEIERIWNASLNARSQPPPESAIEMFCFSSQSGEWALEPAWETALDAAHTHVPRLIAEVKRLRARNPDAADVVIPDLPTTLTAERVVLSDSKGQVAEIERLPATITDGELAEIQRVWDAATAGPWSIEPHGDALTLYSGRSNERHGLNLLSISDLDWNGQANLAAIAKAPTQISALLAEMKRLRAMEKTVVIKKGHSVGPTAGILEALVRDMAPAIGFYAPPKWTSEKPTQPGWYWLRREPGHRARVVEFEVFEDGTTHLHEPGIGREGPVMSYAGWQWAGPIVPPEGV